MITILQVEVAAQSQRGGSEVAQLVFGQNQFSRMGEISCSLEGGGALSNMHIKMIYIILATWPRISPA